MPSKEKKKASCFNSVQNITLSEIKFDIMYNVKNPFYNTKYIFIKSYPWKHFFITQDQYITSIRLV